MIKNINKILILIIGASLLTSCSLKEDKDIGSETPYISSTDLSLPPEFTLKEEIEEDTFEEDKLKEADDFGFSLEKIINRDSFKIKNDYLYGEKLEATIENTTDMIFSSLAFQVRILDSDNVLLGTTHQNIEGFTPGQKRIISLENLPDSAKNIHTIELKYLDQDSYVIVPVNPNKEDENDIGKNEIIEIIDKVEIKKEYLSNNDSFRFSGVVENTSDVTFTKTCANILFFDKNGVCLGSHHMQLEDLAPGSKYKITTTLDSYFAKNVASAKAVIHSYRATK